MTADEIKYCLRCGTALTQAQRAGRMRPVCPQCDWVYFPDPKVAAAVVVMKGDKILLVRRNNQPQQGQWTLPAGFVDAGEDPARAAERECLEETGLTVRISKLINVLSGQEHPHGAHIVIVYLAEFLSGTLQAGDDADQVEFFSLNDLPPLAFATTQNVLKVIAGK
jgi:ADP-ribose pyrophosphatase YjhB (NUDIX family)